MFGRKWFGRTYFADTYFGGEPDDGGGGGPGVPVDGGISVTAAITTITVIR